MALHDTRIAHWSANQMKQLARDVFDEDGESMLTFGLFGRRSVDTTSTASVTNTQNTSSTGVSLQRRSSYKENVKEMFHEPLITFPDDSSGVTDVSASMGSDSSYSNESYNSYDSSRRKPSSRPEISSPQPLIQYREVCSLKYDPKIRCRCSECKSRMTPKKVEAPPMTRKTQYLNEDINSATFSKRQDNARVVNGFSQYSTDTGQSFDVPETEISTLRRNTRRYRSYTPRSQKEMRYRTLQVNSVKCELADEGRKAYLDDFAVRYDDNKRQSIHSVDTSPYAVTAANQLRIQEQTAGYFGDQEHFDSFPGKYFEAYSQVYPPQNTYERQVYDIGKRDSETVTQKYPVNDSIVSREKQQINTEFSKELQQIQAGYQEIEQRLQREKFYRRSYIAAQEKDSSKSKPENSKLSVFCRINGAIKETIKSPAARSKSLTSTPISSPGSVQKENIRSGRSTPNGKQTSEDEKSISPRSEQEIASPKMRLLRSTSLRKGGKKKTKLSRSKSFSEGQKKALESGEKTASPTPPAAASPSVPREIPCIVSLPPPRHKQIYHLDEEDSPEDGLPAVLDQMAKYQNENKAVPLFLNVIQDLRVAFFKLLKESGKLNDGDSTKEMHDIIWKHSIHRKPSYSESAKRTLETTESKEANVDQSSPVSPVSGKIRLNGDELFYKVSLRRKSNEPSPEKPLSVSEDGSTPIHRAAQNGNLDILQILVLNGGDVNALNANGWPALHLSLQSYHFRSALFLIEAGADLKDYTDRRVQEYHKVQKMARRYFQYLETEL